MTIQPACCFTGHRDIPDDLRDFLTRRLSDGITCLQKHGVTQFYTGGALGFDTLAAEAVIKARDAVPGIRLTLVLPCRTQADRWPPAAQERYQRILNAADEVICLSENYYSGCMQFRNRYLIEHSDYCIAYLTRQTGGTAYTVRYAHKKGKTVYNLAPRA